MTVAAPGQDRPARLCRTRNLAGPVLGGVLLALTLLATPALLHALGAGGWAIVGPAVLAALLLLATRTGEWLEPATAVHVRETTLFGLRRRRETALAGFRGIGVARVQQSAGRPSWRILLAGHGRPLSHWGSHCGHVCVQIVSGDRDAAVERARQLAEALPLAYIEH